MREAMFWSQLGRLRPGVVKHALELSHRSPNAEEAPKIFSKKLMPHFRKLWLEDANVLDQKVFDYMKATGVKNA